MDFKLILTFLKYLLSKFRSVLNQLKSIQIIITSTIHRLKFVKIK